MPMPQPATRNPQPTAAPTAGNEQCPPQQRRTLSRALPNLKQQH